MNEIGAVGDVMAGAAPGQGVRRIRVELGARSYPVLVGAGYLGSLVDVLDIRELVPAAGRALVITQEPVIAAGLVAPVESALRGAGLEVHRAVVVDGEAAKSVDVLAGLWRRCAELALTRDDLLVAVGGGVVGDLGGFAAASFGRGIAVLQVPTTLLAQVDAAIGGKTGINLPEGKNLVGAFHQPLAVVCDVDVLGSLSARVRREGFAEIVKYGLIRDPVVLERLEADPGIAAGRPGGGPGPGAGDAHGAVAAPDRFATLVELVERSVQVKATVVAGDEHESGQRAYLNLGHTYGHAVESLTGYSEVLHGEAVAIGTVVALRLGQRLGITPPEVVRRGEQLLASLGLPTRGPSLERRAVWEVMGRDKKAGRDGVRFVLLEDIGRPVLVTPDRAEVDAALDEVA